MKYTKLIIGLILATLVAVGLVYINTRSEEDSMESDQQATELSTESTRQANLSLEARQGTAPEVTSGIPHIQLDQTSDDDTYDKLITRTYEIDGIVGGESQSSLPGAQSIAVAAGLPFNQNAMINGREFAHIHADPGRGSLHLVLSGPDAAEVVENGWGVYHPFHLNGRIPGMVMVFAPRDDQDLGTIINIIDSSFDFATLE
jgi:hypothetical protein